MLRSGRSGKSVLGGLSGQGIRFGSSARQRASIRGRSGIGGGTLGAAQRLGRVLFVNKRRDRIKALWWDGDGFVLWYKRLEQGTFQTVPAPEGEARVRIDSTQLAMILDGVRLENTKRRERFRLSS